MFDPINRLVLVPGVVVASISSVRRTSEEVHLQKLYKGFVQCIEVIYFAS